MCRTRHISEYADVNTSTHIHALTFLEAQSKECAFSKCAHVSIYSYILMLTHKEHTNSHAHTPSLSSSLNSFLVLLSPRALPPMLGPVTPRSDSLIACGLYGAASMTFSRTAPQQLSSSSGKMQDPFSLMSKVAWVGVTSVRERVHVCLQSVGVKRLLNHPGVLFFTFSHEHTQGTTLII